jgi:hypothetical protein
MKLITSTKSYNILVPFNKKWRIYRPISSHFEETQLGRSDTQLGRSDIEPDGGLNLQ